jgi:uncharacterized membrane protein
VSDEKNERKLRREQVRRLRKELRAARPDKLRVADEARRAQREAHGKKPGCAVTGLSVGAALAVGVARWRGWA